MSKLTCAMLGGVLVLGLAACESNPSKPAAQAAYDSRCKFGATDVLAPDWKCHPKAEGMAVVGVGSYPPSKAGEQFMMDQATLAARKDLAAQAKIYVAELIKSHKEVTGFASEETVDAAASSTSKSVTEGTLYGSKRIDSAYGPDGTLYVMVGLVPEQATRAAEAAIKSSMNNDKALWQKFLAQKGQDELAAELAKPKP